MQNKELFFVKRDLESFLSHKSRLWDNRIRYNLNSGPCTLPPHRFIDKCRTLYITGVIIMLKMKDKQLHKQHS